jgi:mono/diheme cytochrome c family protein
MKGRTMMRQKITAALIGLIWCSASAAIAADGSAGKVPYEKSCAGCHGADGKGNEKMATILGVKDLGIVGKDTAKKTDAQLLKIIADGSGKMPASKLSKDEQKQILTYARSLAK